ncbi:hypothetical protein AVEN_134689-1 [Araneus ventricosus]|uniref:Uncharacterized protein n=1 Tax=Araneus ventricosus TaxID=182803 RepID=A0A4Y2HVD9_ARAVE|nr:hypothetical protein AVEN_134689-1 [Araneus ventricosus]
MNERFGERNFGTREGTRSKLYRESLPMAQLPGRPERWQKEIRRRRKVKGPAAPPEKLQGVALNICSIEQDAVRNWKDSVGMFGSKSSHGLSLSEMPTFQKRDKRKLFAPSCMFSKT